MVIRMIILRFRLLTELIPWVRALLDVLKVVQMSKKLSDFFFLTRNSIRVFTSASYWALY
jgi:hypothetical protein